MSKAKFNVLYDGEALANSEMDVKDLAPALLALGSLLEEANSIINGDKAKVTVNVKASFKTGCFGIELDTVVSLYNQAQSLFSEIKIANAEELLTWIGLYVGAPLTACEGFRGLLGLIKWVKNRRISKIEILNDGVCRVFIDKDRLDVEKEVIQLYQNRKVREIFQKILSPLEREGINEFAVTDIKQTGRFTTITKEEIEYFVIPPTEDVPLADELIEMNLQLVNVSFQDDNKWKFSDGNANFFAAILDDDFLNRVSLSEVSFSKGDILRAKVRKYQYMKNESMKTDYEIVKVIDHKRSSSQLSLPISMHESDLLD